MVPAGFDEANTIISTPEGSPLLRMEENTVEPLYAFQGHIEMGIPVTVTCWKITKEELEEFQRTGRIWLVVAGPGMPAVSLVVKKPLEELPSSP